MSVSEPLVSVVIPAFNASAHLEEALDSTAAQQEVALEIIVIDDGSSDGTASVAERRGDPRVSVLRHPNGANRGTSRSRALGVAAARGAYVALLDADDAFLPGKLADQVAALRDDEAAVMCHTAAVLEHEADDDPVWMEADLDPARLPNRYRLEERPEYFRWNLICNSTVLCRTEAARRLPGFAQRFRYEDWTWWTLLAEQGPFLYLRRPGCRYRAHANTATKQVRQDPLVPLWSTAEHCLCILAWARTPATKEAAMARLQETLGAAWSAYADSEKIGNVGDTLSSAALLQRVGALECELARLRRAWPRRLAGWSRRVLRVLRGERPV